MARTKKVNLPRIGKKKLMMGSTESEYLVHTEKKFICIADYYKSRERVLVVTPLDWDTLEELEEEYSIHLDDLREEFAEVSERIIKQIKNTKEEEVMFENKMVINGHEARVEVYEGGKGHITNLDGTDFMYVTGDIRDGVVKVLCIDVVNKKVRQAEAWLKDLKEEYLMIEDVYTCTWLSKIAEEAFFDGSVIRDKEDGVMEINKVEVTQAEEVAVAVEKEVEVVEVPNIEEFSVEVITKEFNKKFPGGAQGGMVEPGMKAYISKDLHTIGIKTDVIDDAITIDVYKWHPEVAKIGTVVYTYDEVCSAFRSLGKAEDVALQLLGLKEKSVKEADDMKVTVIDKKHVVEMQGDEVKEITNKEGETVMRVVYLEDIKTAEEFEALKADKNVTIEFVKPKITVTEVHVTDIKSTEEFNEYMADENIKIVFGDKNEETAVTVEDVTVEEVKEEQPKKMKAVVRRKKKETKKEDVKVEEVKVEEVKEVVADERQEVIDEAAELSAAIAEAVEELGNKDMIDKLADITEDNAEETISYILRRLYNKGKTSFNEEMTKRAGQLKEGFNTTVDKAKNLSIWGLISKLFTAILKKAGALIKGTVVFAGHTGQILFTAAVDIAKAFKVDVIDAVMQA